MSFAAIGMNQVKSQAGLFMGSSFDHRAKAQLLVAP
jgi:hypothetical protein